MSYQKVYMNQVHSSTLLSQLAQMWKSQLLCDAIIKTGAVTTKAHRLVLVAACPMLQSMENASVGSHLEVRLAAEIKQDAVNTFLQYLYEGFMMLTEENVRDVEKVARLLQVESVITCCADFDKCLRSKNGSLPPNAPYKYNFADLVEFRHVRTTDLQKTVQERMMKRAAEMSRPSSPGHKRPRMHRPPSPSSDISFIGANRTDDTLSMTQSYMSGGSHSGSQWDRVPHTGSGMSRSGHSHIPGVIDIMEDSIELVQTEPPEKGGTKPDPKVVQKSVSVSISSQISNTDVQVVNVGDSDTRTVSSKTSVTPTPSSSSSRGSITVSHLTVFGDSPAGRDSTNRVQDKKEESRQSDNNQTSLHRPDGHSSQKSSPFPISLSTAPPSSGQSKSFGQGSSGQTKPFAVGSATQASFSHSSPLASSPSVSSPSARNTSRSDSLERASPADKSKGLKKSEPPESSTADMTPDLSIVKVETRNSESVDTGGLDMYVDMPEQGVMHMHHRTDDDEHGEGSDIEYEEPSGDWSREDMSNEGSNISGDQNNSWYVGTFKDGQNYYVTGNFGKFNQSNEDTNFNQSNEDTNAVSAESIYSDIGPNHRLVHIKGNKRACAYCNILRMKTKSGWAIKSYYICEACNVPLCRGQKECFYKYHELVAQNKGLSPEMLKKKLKLPKPTEKWPKPFNLKIKYPQTHSRVNISAESVAESGDLMHTVEDLVASACSEQEKNDSGQTDDESIEKAPFSYQY